VKKLIQIDDKTKQEITMAFSNEPLPVSTPVLVSGWGEKIFYLIFVLVSKILIKF
jgi:hypothetical protein